MKRIFLAFALISVSFTASYAQNASQAAPVSATQEVDARLSFGAKINELEAVMNRNSAEIAQKVFMQLAEQMTKASAATSQELTKATGDEKTRLKKVSEKQNELYGAIKTLSVDIMNNKAAMVSKLKEFQTTL